MRSSARSRPFEPFFLRAGRGERFCIFHPASADPRGAVLYLPPFAEEMNKSRRMAALQSRALAASGLAVLQIDLFGCGDSSGEYGEASWEIWREDVALAMRWLAQHVHPAITMWGLRLGALLALDAAPQCDPAPAAFVFWQPVLKGEALMTQFLRLRVASEMLSEGKSRSGVQDLRAALAAGATVEIAGYDLSQQLVAAIDDLALDAQLPARAVHWFEVVAQAGRALPAPAQRIVDNWSRDGLRIDVHRVEGQPFWNTVEITECPALISATTDVLFDHTQ